ncbi:hypothetical protein [Pontibacillus marinus]|uniref:Uncharacterized protein n=1 Tax=Pontibacillus marinus BH030004 = DSM 16465 TaxID=1385511 RepID=A0A0A5G0P3_9BACI|nr:hypothetical protein [Pontibacillus marinus]KGX86681.1 hypothetical protein N783_11855 [Pontibacillus marinus BH030004 = DSM 16465]
MLKNTEGKMITEVAYKTNYTSLMKKLPQDKHRAIVTELNRIADQEEVITSSWIPGSDWRGTVYEPIWEACGRNDEVAAKFYGQILYKVIIDHPAEWLFGKYDHARGKTYFRVRSR